MSLVIMFYFTSSMLNLFRTLIHSPSGTCYFSIVSPHWSCILVSMCVRHTSKQEHTTSVVIQ